MFENVNAVDVLIESIVVLSVALITLYFVMKWQNKRNLETLVNMVDNAIDKEFSAIAVVDNELKAIKSDYHLQEFTENRINTAKIAKTTLHNALETDEYVGNSANEIDDYIYQKIKVAAIKNRQSAETDNVVVLKAVANNR